MTTPRDLAARAAGHQFASEAEINQWLAQQGITDPEIRLSYKIELMANGALATDHHHAPGTLATDLSRYTPETPPVGREMAGWLRKAGLSVDRSWSEPEITEALSRSDLDTVTKMAVRAELHDRKCVRAAAAKHVRASWEMSAKADERPRGKILTDRQGRPLVLRSQPV